MVDEQAWERGFRVDPVDYSVDAGEWCPAGIVREASPPTPSAIRKLGLDDQREAVLFLGAMSFWLRKLLAIHRFVSDLGDEAAADATLVLTDCLPSRLRGSPAQTHRPRRIGTRIVRETVDVPERPGVESYLKGVEEILPGPSKRLRERLDRILVAQPQWGDLWVDHAGFDAAAQRVLPDWRGFRVELKALLDDVHALIRTRPLPLHARAEHERLRREPATVDPASIGIQTSATAAKLLTEKEHSAIKESLSGGEWRVFLRLCVDHPRLTGHQVIQEQYGHGGTTNSRAIAHKLRLKLAPFRLTLNNRTSAIKDGHIPAGDEKGYRLARVD